MTPQSAIAHYQITSKIGEGGMGAVYRAHDTKLGRDVAIKVLPEAFASDPDRLARFTREAHLLASLNHPNIAAIYGVEDRALIMELVEGEDLQGPLALDQALVYAGQIADALEAAHEKGIIHRDLKPANIRITPEGVVKVLDFGLAKSAEPSGASSNPANSPTLTIHASRAGTILGTAAYMAPEQARGQAVDKRADIWAFGVVLWEMLTGRQMFEGATVSDVLASVLKTEPDLNAVPAPVRPVIRACLEKDPRKRLRDIGDWRRLLDTPKLLPKRRAWLPWAIAATAVIAAAAALLVLPRQQPSASPLIHVVEESFGRLDLDSGAGPAIAISPNGRYIAYAIDDANNIRRLSIRRVGESTPVELPGTENASSMFFSPDSRWLAYEANGTFFKVSTEGGMPTRLAAGLDLVRGAAWARDGTIIFGNRSGRPLYRVTADDGTPQPFTRLEAGETDHRYPTICAGLETVVFFARRPEGLHWLPLKGGERKPLLADAEFPRCLPSGELLFIRRGVLHSVRLDSRMQFMSEPNPVLTNIAAVLNLHASQVSVSDNGDAAFVAGWFDNERPVLTWIERDGRATPIAMVPRAFVPRLSPDGKRVAYLGGDIDSSDVFVRDLERNTTMRITSDGKPKTTGLVWSLDGKSVLYGSNDQAGGIYVVSSNGGIPPRKILDGKWNPRDLRNDRKWLLVTSGEQIAAAPIVVNDAGITADQPREILRVVRSGLQNHPIFSPDGRWVIYNSSETGARADLYLRSFEGNARHVLPTEGGVPVWSANGQLTTAAAPNLRVCSMKPDTLQCESPRVLTQHRIATRSAVPMFDVAPDGRILAFLAQPPIKPEPPRVHLLFNFLSRS